MATVFAPRAFHSQTTGIRQAPAGGHCHVQRAGCTFWAGAPFRQCRAVSISASVAPWLLAHISAADAEYFAT